ncbi:MAG TPA: TrmH family RNA methyltransferase [Gemmatimonadaceae bacterium]|nr:TrmH family RNA methyltransferase [Gemmatimonadaceae bacterium]
MADSKLDSIRVVLYEPQDPVNIAATVRAMKNMGVGALALIRPVPFDPVRLEGIAHGTQDLIERIQVHQSLETAVSDCVRVLAFTARRRAAKFRVLEPKAAAAELLSAVVEGPVAMVFGREDSGLPNEILDRVHALVTIPTTDHASINLAQAALIGLYELHVAAADATRTLAPPRKAAPPPTQGEFDLFFTDAERSLAAIEFFKTRNAEHIMRSLRALTFRADPDARELSLLRAMYIEVVRFLERTGRGAGRRP